MPVNVNFIEGNVSSPFIFYGLFIITRLRFFLKRLEKREKGGFFVSNQNLIDNVATNLFKAMEIITNEKINKLEFDKTIVCSIEDAKEAKKGIYQVTDGSTYFTAYSDNFTYTEGTQVYVKIPNGDMSNKKYITDLYMGEDDGYIYYVSPLNAFIDISGNLISDNFSSEYQIEANGALKQVVIWEYFPSYHEEERIRLTTLITNLKIEYEQKKKEVEDDKLEALTNQYNYSLNYYQSELDKITSKTFKGYERLGIRGEFRTEFNRNIQNGLYGLKVEIMEKTVEGVTVLHRYYLDSSNMFGNSYDYGLYLSQEGLFDISALNEIIGIQLFLYQDNNFSLNTGESLDAGNIIFLQKPYLSLGYASESFKEDTVIIGTYDSVTYSTQDDIINRSVFLRWIHNQGERFYSIDEIEEIPNEAKIHWYRYRLEHNRIDELAGSFWQEFDPGIDIFNYSFSPEYGRAEDNFKVIIEYPSRDYITQKLEVNEEIRELINKFENNILLTKDKVQELCYITDLEKLSQTFNIYKNDIKNNSELITVLNSIYEIILNNRIETKYYNSKEIKFINQIDQNDETIDLVKSLSIDVDKDGYGGIYHIYDTTNNIINIQESNILRTLTATYTSMATAEEGLGSAEEITWYFPKADTMIATPALGKEYQDGEFIEASDQEGYYAIKRAGIELTDSSISGLQLIEINQKFRIKDYYDQNAVNNTIYCKVKKRGKIYTASTTLLFGPAGMLKNAQTLKLRMYDALDNVVSAMTLDEGIGDRTITIVPQLLDANNKTINIGSGDITYSWLFSGNNGIEGRQSGSNYILNFTNSSSISNCLNYILQAEVKVREVNNDLNNKEEPPVLISYLPIAVRTKVEYEIEGPNEIIYNANGVAPSYYNKPFKVISEVEDTIYYWFDTTSGTGQGYPEIGYSGLFKVPALFTSGLSGYSVYASTTTDTNTALANSIYIQPILIIKAPETTASILKDWNGSLTINENNDTILSAMLGAGVKNSNNQFTGMLMGDIKLGGGDNVIGLYGYQDNKNTFGFLANGTAYMGYGNSKIEFNGMEGKITGNTIKGGSIIGSTIHVPDRGEAKFSVTEQGIMTCTGANIQGNVEIESGRIELGEGFSVDTAGNMRCQNAIIEGALLGGDFKKYDNSNYTFIGGSYSTGSVGSGSYFNVNADGILRCEGIEVTGGEITIIEDGNKDYSFSVTKKGYLTCKGASMEELTIKGGSIDIMDADDPNKIRFSASKDGVSIYNGSIEIMSTNKEGEEIRFSASKDGVSIYNGSIEIRGADGGATFIANKNGISLSIGFDVEEKKPVFEVNTDGHLTCTNATITGVLKAGKYDTFDNDISDDDMTYVDEKGILHCRNANIKKATITNASISSGSISNAKISSGSITSASISSGSITSASISDATINSATINSCTIGDYLIFNKHQCKLMEKTIPIYKPSGTGDVYVLSNTGRSALINLGLKEGHFLELTQSSTTIECVSYK